MATDSELLLTTLAGPEVNCTVCGEHDQCQESISAVRFVVLGVVMNVVNVLGIVCNTVSIYILSRKKMRASINCCLIGLATFDILLLVCSILVWGVPAISQYSVSLRWLDRQVISHMTPWLYPLAAIAHTGSTYVTVTVTVERYVAVCHSLKARYICTYGRARLYMIVISVFVVLYNVPKFLETEVQPIISLRDNRTTVGYFACTTKLRVESRYIEIYITWMYFIVVYCIPFGTLVVLNGLIYRKVRIANRMRQLLSVRQEREIGLASMLFAIVLLFMMCNSMSFVLNIVEKFNSSYTIVSHTRIERLTEFSNLLINVNSASNFVIYCIFGQKFRRLFLQLFCRPVARRFRCTLRGTDDVSMPGAPTNGAGVPMTRLGRSLRASAPPESRRLLTQLPTPAKAPPVDGPRAPPTEPLGADRRTSDVTAITCISVTSRRVSDATVACV